MLITSQLAPGRTKVNRLAENMRAPWAWIGADCRRNLAISFRTPITGSDNQGASKLFPDSIEPPNDIR